MQHAHNGLYVVMGVAGSGKSTIGSMLAAALGVAFVEGDDYHSRHNVDLMARGIPLNDADRADWLRDLADRIRQARTAGTGLVMACSALTRAYPDSLQSEAPELRFVFRDGPQ